ncbi:MAG: hypothetical protein HUU28_18550 [Planctomycetaceae bacterium]|nr:hypothetical protein [Planctomycetaceae bacterium]
MDKSRQLAFQILSGITFCCGSIVASQAFSFAWPKRLTDERTQDYLADHALLIGVLGIGLMAMGLALTLTGAPTSSTKDRVDSPGADGR